MKNKNSIIRDFDKFNKVNEKIEEDPGMFGSGSFLDFVSGTVGKQAIDTLKEQVVVKIMDYFGISPDKEGGIADFLRDVVARIISKLDKDDMDDILLGRIYFTDGEFWIPRISEAFCYVLKGFGTKPIVQGMGLDPDKLVGRLVVHVVDNTLTDTEEMERILTGLWDFVAKRAYFPAEDPETLYKQALAQLPKSQQDKIEKGGGGIWSSSALQRSKLGIE